MTSDTVETDASRLLPSLALFTQLLDRVMSFADIM